MKGPLACPICGLILAKRPKDMAEHVLKKAASGDEDHRAWLKSRVRLDNSSVRDVMTALDY